MPAFKCIPTLSSNRSRARFCVPDVLIAADELFVCAFGRLFGLQHTGECEAATVAVAWEFVFGDTIVDVDSAQVA